MNTLIVAVLSVMTLALVNCEWDQKQRDFILDMHNEMRRRPKNACEMNKLAYDMDLERQAKTWAEGCVYDHESLPERGENLAFNTMEWEPEKLISNSMNAFYDEIKYFSYGQRGCSRDCHYYQLVYGVTKKVGCYTHRCPSLSRAYGARNAWYLVCFYSPKPYRKNPYEINCKSKCLPSQTIDDGLCVGGDKETSGDKPTKPTDDCKDLESSCAFWANKNECFKNPVWMKENCPKSCGFCSGSPSTACQDMNGNCKNWARNNQCIKNPNYMMKNCMKSCKAC